MDSEKTPLILSKVIPVFVYNLMYIQLYCGDWDFYFPVGLSRNYSIFHFFSTEQIKLNTKIPCKNGGLMALIIVSSIR